MENVNEAKKKTTTVAISEDTLLILKKWQVRQRELGHKYTMGKVVDIAAKTLLKLQDYGNDSDT